MPQGPEDKPYTWGDHDRMEALHKREHDRIDKHLSTLHARLWAALITLVMGLTGLVGWLMTHGPVIK